jgi:hypothetical protein
MGTGKRQMMSMEEYEETRNLLLRCLQVLRQNPEMTPEDLLRYVRDQIEQDAQTDELARKMAKDD